MKNRKKKTLKTISNVIQKRVAFKNAEIISTVPFDEHKTVIELMAFRKRKRKLENRSRSVSAECSGFRGRNPLK